MNATRFMLSAMAICVGLAVPMARAQGSLTPPGAPAPTMKTLAQVEPRTPITNAPYTITQPGAYYLATNLVSTGHGVIIRASGVTLDLMGFALTGDREWSSADSGIVLEGASNAPIRDVTIRNGSVRNFHEGLSAQYCLGGRFEHLTVSGHIGFGFYFYGGSGQCDGNTLADCAIHSNGYAGIFFNGPSGQCDGNTLTDCAIQGNGGDGVSFAGDAGRVYGNRIAGCAIQGNGGDGVALYGTSGECNGNVVVHCAIGGNGDRGVYLNGLRGQCNGNAISDCTIRSNGTRGVHLLGGSSGRCDGNRIADCTISGNGTQGVSLSSGLSGQCNGNTMADCTISGNGHHGVQLYNNNDEGQCKGNTIVNCVIRKNEEVGISLNWASENRVEGNHISDQIGVATIGIYSGGTVGNLMIHNTCVGQTANFDLSADDTYGPIVASAGALATTGAAAHPWANFSR